MAPKTPQRRLTYQERNQIRALRLHGGWSYAAISRKLEIPYETVRRTAHSETTPTKPAGRRPILDSPIRTQLINHATSSREQRLKPLREIAHELGINADERTLRKAFKTEGYFRRVATERPLLKPEHMNKRLFWATICKSWEQEIWRRVVWSDEASFRIGKGNKVYVTRRAEEKYHRDCCVPKFRDFSCVMVWACIGGDGSKGPLLIWDRSSWGNITAASYIQRVLPVLQSFIMEHEIFRVGIGNALFMQDNASPHRLIETKKALYERAIRLLWWPPNLPDLNLIENVWRLLKYRVQARFLASKAELIRVIKEEWDKIEFKDIQKYCTNMKERCKAAYDAEGGPTPY